MMRPPRPEPRNRSAAAAVSNPFDNVLNESQRSLISDDDDDDDSVNSQQSTQRRHKPPRPSLLPRQSFSQRRRRRSSGRFLNLDRRSINSTSGSAAHAPNYLSELYQKAVQLNVENKINATNSWNLNLIEHIDQVLVDNNDDNNDDESNPNRVNFTKASCTLDASVKIYSYRVDDVHLTSYKVLANLNRNDNQKKNKKKDNDNEIGSDANETTTTTRGGEKITRGSTLETQVANINTNKLDAAFDIDPLFHKMSKTFDEGGAKGLLLVNLGVSDHGCNIVFDSSEQQDTTAMGDNQEVNSDEGDVTKWDRIDEGMVDITSLTQKLDSLLSDENAIIRELPLVPQLSSLRAEHHDLIDGGFCDGNALLATVGPKTPGKRKYHADEEEEREAADTIHKEAAAKRNFNVSAAKNLTSHFGEDSPMGDNNGDFDDGDNFVDFNAGGGYDDGFDNDDDDVGFDDFIANARFSEESSGANTVMGNNSIAVESNNATSNLIDAIASGETQLSTNDYEFLPQNMWAGAAHWKRTKAPAKSKKQSAAPKTPAKHKKKKVASKKGKLVDLRNCPDLSEHLKTPSKKKAKTTQLSKAMITKYTNQENKLPEDAGLGVSELSQLFLRPNVSAAAVGDNSSDPAVEPHITKTVDFNLGDTEYDDGSFGGDDDGGGFDFGGDDDEDGNEDDFCISELEGVRKVEKVKVGYAMVAKKVDVKKLKKELWTEIESQLLDHIEDDSNDNGDVENQGGNDDEESAKEDVSDDTEKPTTKTASSSMTPVSFQDTVHDMEAQKTQMDVTLPFYFICILHLANEKGLRLESQGLEDFTIYQD